MIGATNLAWHFYFYDFDLRGRSKGHLGKYVFLYCTSPCTSPYIIFVNISKMVMILRKVFIIWLIQLIKLDIFCFYDFDLGGHFKGHLGKNVGFIAYSYIIIVNNLKTVMISRTVYRIWLIQIFKLDLFLFLWLWPWRSF